MARSSLNRALSVWSNGLHVGRWTMPNHGPTTFTYDAKWVDSKEGRPLSLSLPINLDDLTIRGERVDNYFDNLLPDSDAIRRRVQSRYGLVSQKPFDLLTAIGRDCVGAVQLLPLDEPPRDTFTIEVRTLRDEQIGQRLRTLSYQQSPLGDDDELPISLAGAQEKTAFTRHRGRWCLPQGATPTTHIFKLPLGLVGNTEIDLTTSIENEWLCSRLLKEFGLPVADCEIAQFGAVKALVVTRFDRRLHESRKYWLRLPQEDFCQAMGMSPATKYEADGGPGLLQLATVLQASEARDADLATLLRAQLLFWMLAATDGHAKNFSIRLLPRGHFQLSPLYDVISAWPIVGTKSNQLHEKKLKLAMALHGANKHYRLTDIRRHHFNATARRCGLGDDMESIISATLDAVPRVVDRVAADLPTGFPEQVFAAVTAGLIRAAHFLARQPPH